LVRDRQTKEPMTPFNGTSKEMNRLRRELLDQGLFLYTHWHTILLLPPLIITPDQLVEGFSMIDQALRITDAVVQ
jgi:taurine---2-oxoglutarate transaminase